MIKWKSSPLALAACILSSLTAADLTVAVHFDPVSANGIITYDVPADAPAEIRVKAVFQLDGSEFKPAAVNKFRSETAITISAGSKIFADEQKNGEVTEYMAAGRKRIMVWSTAQQLPTDASVQGRLKLSVAAASAPDTVIAEKTVDFNVDLSRVVVLDEFVANPGIYPKIVAGQKSTVPGWYQTVNGLEVYEKEDLLEPLIYRHSLSGYYAIYVKVPKNGYGEIELELTTDGFSQRFSAFDGHEYFWKIARMDGTHLVIRQPYRTLFTLNDALMARLKYVKFVPVSQEAYERYAANRQPGRDKLVAGYFEPYSWAFREYVMNSSKFLEAAAAYHEAGVDFVDMQAGRGGSKPLYPSALEIPVMETVSGDPAPGSRVQPTSLGPSRMVRVTDPILATLRGCKAYDMQASVNFGAAINYINTSMESEFSKANPELFIERYYLDYSKQEARRHLLNYYREVLEKGARNLTIDFCRYPHAIRKAEEATAFLRELRALTRQFETGGRVGIMVRFPVPGCKGVARENGKFNPETWVKEQLVDFLVPADFGGMLYFDVKPYIGMVQGSNVKVLPCIEGLRSGPPFPGEALRRVDEFYRAGAHGVYLYQADAHIVGSMTGSRSVDHDTIRTFGYSGLTRQKVAEDSARMTEYSTDVYLHYPLNYQSNRIFFRIDGLRPDKVEMYVDGELYSTRTQEPYFLGEQGFENHYKFLGKDRLIKVVVTAGGQVFTKEFPPVTVLRAHAF